MPPLAPDPVTGLPVGLLHALCRITPGPPRPPARVSLPRRPAVPVRLPCPALAKHDITVAVPRPAVIDVQLPAEPVVPVVWRAPRTGHRGSW